MLAGQRFGLLTVAEGFGVDPARGALWLCRCDCGNELIRSTGELRRVKRAACRQCHLAHHAARCTKHGDTLTKAGPRSPLYKVWQSMRDRCENPDHRFSRYYGAKGVKVCPEWMEYAEFRDWAIANGYSHDPSLSRGDQLSLDRIDPAGDYAPQNCRWIPVRENSRRAQVKEQKSVH